MDLIKGIYYDDSIKKPDMKEQAKKTVDKPKSNISNGKVNGMDFSSTNNVVITLDDSSSTQQKKSTPRRKSNVVNTTGVVPADNKTKYSPDEPYIDKYQETNAILKTAIAQIDIGLQDMQQDLNYLRSNKTLRNKYQQLSLIQGNMGSYIGNKIQAARELNNTISKCNDLELKRAKELKALDEQDDDKRIMDLYNAMISMPVGGQNGMMPGFSTAVGPNTFEMTYAGNPNSPTPNIITTVDGEDDNGYQRYLQNKTPAQRMMSLDANPNIKQVVVHNNATGQSYFEIMDMTTMTPIPNVDKYDNSFLEDTHMDFVNNVATNVNIGESYPIVQIGGDPILNEY